MTAATAQRRAGSYEQRGPTRTAATARLRSTAAWVAILVLGAVALVALGSRPAEEGRFLDPRSAAPAGSRAIAEVLGGNGVDVSVVTTLAAVPTGTPGTSVVVTADELISAAALVAVAERSRAADRLIVLLAIPEAVGELSAELSGLPAWAGVSAPASRCEIPEVRPGDVVTGGEVFILERARTTADEPVNGTAEPTLCLPPTVALDPGGLLARLPATSQRPEILLVGFSGALTNGEITAEDNAAVSLRLLGGSPRLVWLIPDGIDTLDLPGSPDGSSRSPWPTSSLPVALVLAAGTIALALVRGRRLGRLVPEPLPVIVRAAETTESRAHLYRRSRDLHRAATILRQGAASRLRRRLGIAATDPIESLLVAVAAASGEPSDRVAHLLSGPAPSTSADLITLRKDLDDLERKVRLT